MLPSISSFCFCLGMKWKIELLNKLFCTFLWQEWDVCTHVYQPKICVNLHRRQNVKAPNNILSQFHFAIENEDWRMTETHCTLAELLKRQVWDVSRLRRRHWKLILEEKRWLEWRRQSKQRRKKTANEKQNLFLTMAPFGHTNLPNDIFFPEGMGMIEQVKMRESRKKASCTKWTREDFFLRVSHSEQFSTFREKTLQGAQWTSRQLLRPSPVTPENIVKFVPFGTNQSIPVVLPSALRSCVFFLFVCLFCFFFQNGEHTNTRNAPFLMNLSLNSGTTTHSE